MNVLLTALFGAMISGLSLLITKIFAKADENCGYNFKWPYLVGLALYGLAAGYAVCITPFILGKIFLVFIFGILGSEGYIDLQTSQVYILQTIALVLFAGTFFLIRLFSGELDVVLKEECGPIGMWFSELFGGSQASTIKVMIVTMVITILLGLIKAIAIGDVWILGAIAVTYLGLGSGADQRFLMCVLSSYVIFSVIYIFRLIYDKKKHKVSILKKRYPFTAPIAVAAVLSLILSK